MEHKIPFDASNHLCGVRIEEGDEPKVLYFGACDEKNKKKFDPLYMYHSSSKELKPQSFNKKRIPEKRSNHTFTTSETTNKAYVVGGRTDDKCYQKEVYEVNLTTLEFRLLKLDESEEKLPPIAMHTCHLINNDRDLLVVGGCDGSTISRDILTINLATMKVEWYAHLPLPLCAHSSIVVDNKYLLVNSGTNGNYLLKEFLRLDLESREWSYLTRVPRYFSKDYDIETPRIGNTACKGLNDLAIFFGGHDGNE